MVRTRRSTCSRRFIPMQHCQISIRVPSQIHVVTANTWSQGTSPKKIDSEPGSRRADCKEKAKACSLWVRRAEEHLWVCKMYCDRDSSSRYLLDAFKARVQESDRACPDFDSEMFFPFNKKPIVPPILSSTPAVSKAPPRLVSDQMINIFFQEWAPLFPVLHRPSFLKLYAEYVVSPDGLDNQPFVAQLNLVFGIAALSNEVLPESFLSPSLSLFFVSSSCLNRKNY